MPRKGMYKMPIKIFQLDLVLVSIFKEFVEFSHSSAIVKIAVTNENLIETNISKVTFRFDLKMPIRFFGFCNLHYFDQKFDTLS